MDPSTSSSQSDVAADPQAEATPLVTSAARIRTGVEELYLAHFNFVWRSLRRLGVLPHALDDATQEVFLVVHRRYDSFQPGTSERAWLFVIAQRVASDQRRSVRRKGGLLPLPEGLTTNDCDPYDLTVKREARDLVLRFLDSVHDNLRVVFILAELEQMTANEISSATGVNRNTVYTRLAAVRRQFAAYLESQPQLPSSTP